MNSVSTWFIPYKDYRGLYLQIHSDPVFLLAQKWGMEPGMLYSYKGKPSNLESINVQLSRKDIHEYNLQMRAILDDLKNDSEVRQKVEALILNLAEQIESTESSLKSLKSDLKTYIL